jgi:hypothetical protein
MKGDLSLFLYLMLVVIIGLILIIVLMSKLSPLDSPQGRSKELAMVVSLHIDALSSVQEGTMKIDTGKNKYDVEIQQGSGAARAIGSVVAPYIPFAPDVNPNGNYVVVTPYNSSGSKLEKQAGISMINSYNPDIDYYIKVENTSIICLKKTAQIAPADKSNVAAQNNLAYLVKCND